MGGLKTPAAVAGAYGGTLLSRAAELEQQLAEAQGELPGIIEQYGQGMPQVTQQMTKINDISREWHETQAQIRDLGVKATRPSGARDRIALGEESRAIQNRIDAGENVSQADRNHKAAIDTELAGKGRGGDGSRQADNAALKDANDHIKEIDRRVAKEGFLMKTPDRQALATERAGWVTQRDAVSARIQGKSGAPAPPKSAPTAQRGPSPMGPDGMPMDRATIPEGKMSRGSNGKTYRSVGGWMQFVTPAPAGAGEGALATGSDGRRYRNVGGWMQLVQ